MQNDNDVNESFPKLSIAMLIQLVNETNLFKKGNTLLSNEFMTISMLRKENTWMGKALMKALFEFLLISK